MRHGKRRIRSARILTTISLLMHTTRALLLLPLKVLMLPQFGRKRGCALTARNDTTAHQRLVDSSREANVLMQRSDDRSIKCSLTLVLALPLSDPLDTVMAVLNGRASKSGCPEDPTAWVSVLSYATHQSPAEIRRSNHVRTPYTHRAGPTR